MSESSWRSRLIMGSALGAAAVAVIIDHTRHPLPEPVVEQPAPPQEGAVVIVVDGDEASGSPCALDASPCALDASPCALDASPCSL